MAELEGDYLFRTWCEAHNKPVTIAKLQEQNPDLTEEQIDNLWEEQLEQYDMEVNKVDVKMKKFGDLECIGGIVRDFVMALHNADILGIVYSDKNLDRVFVNYKNKDGERFMLDISDTDVSEKQKIIDAIISGKLETLENVKVYKLVHYKGAPDSGK